MLLLAHGMVQVHLLLCVEVVALWYMWGNGWNRRQGVCEAMVHYVLWWWWGVECGVWRLMARVKSARGDRKKASINTFKVNQGDFVIRVQFDSSFFTTDF